MISIGLGNLAFGKVGFKIALAVVAGGAALLWARRRRDDHTDHATDPALPRRGGTGRPVSVAASK